ncbi:restriction endonuclease subunit S [Vibrio harveyi]|nr:restriction endonuclease subunit S [Vibrio harveyi]
MIPLGELITLQRGHDLPSSKRAEGSIPIMGSSGITGYHNKAKCIGEGVIVGRSGNSMGEVSFVDEDYWPLNTCLYVTDFKGNDPKYIYYLLKTVNFDQFNSGSAQKSLNRNAVYPFEVHATRNKAVQREVGNCLSRLESKVTLNIQTNQTLEEMAQAIFKSWFVDFDPVKAKLNGEQPKGMDAATASLFPEKLVESELGLIPEGWEVKPLDKIAHFENGLALQKFRPESEDDDFLPVLKIAQLRQGYCDGKEKARTDIKESCRVYNGDMIFSWSGTLMIDLWAGGKSALNQHLFKVTSKDYTLPLYLYWTKHHLVKFQQIAKDKAVTMGHIKRGHLSESLCVVPPKDLRDKMDEILMPLINQGLNMRLQSNQLATLRDTLLPKLLSGEIELETK